MLYLLEFFDVDGWIQWGGDIFHGTHKVGISEGLEQIISFLLAQSLESVCQQLHLVQSCKLIGEFLHILATPTTKCLQHKPKPNRHSWQMHL